MRPAMTDTAPDVNTPSTGPIPRDEFFSLVDAPCGRAAQVIRRYDPLWGRGLGDGKKIKWRVKLTQLVTMAGYVTVEAESQEEAEHLAEQIPDIDVSWDFECADLPVAEEVEPMP